MTFGHVPSSSMQTAESNSVNGLNRNGRNPGRYAGTYCPEAPRSAHESVDISCQPPFRQLNDRQELLPPFLAHTPVKPRPRLRSFGLDHPSYPESGDLSSRVMEAAQSMATLPQIRHFQHKTAYPSPITSAFDTPDRGIHTPSSSVTTRVMPPPYSTSSFATYTERDASPERAAKRVRLSGRGDRHQNHDANRRHRASSYSPCDVYELQAPPLEPHTPTLISPCLMNPMTPASSSSNSDEADQTSRLASNLHSVQGGNIRRVSVSSLLSASPDLERTRKIWSESAQVCTDPVAIPPLPSNGSPSRQRANSDTNTETYGVDRGLPDLDVPRNNDTAAINDISPPQHSDYDSLLESVDLGAPEFGFGVQKREFVFAKGGYYASPVPIKIPRKLELLPSTLLNNPMNLMYFHHFLNHTARILVVHDCSQNPFRTILPQSEHLHHSNLFTGD